MAISRSGLVTNDVRALAWPKLLNVDPNRKLRRRSWEELTRHRDYNQVVLDVRRSLRRFPPGLTQEEQELLQVKLNTLILRVLCEHQELHYYQVRVGAVLNGGREKLNKLGQWNYCYDCMILAKELFTEVKQWFHLLSRFLMSFSFNSVFLPRVIMTSV